MHGHKSMCHGVPLEGVLWNPDALQADYGVLDWVRILFQCVAPMRTPKLATYDRDQPRNNSAAMMNGIEAAKRFVNVMHLQLSVRSVVSLEPRSCS